MIEQATTLVQRYIEEHTEPGLDYSIFVVWQATILQNFKCLISTTRPIGMYFELTYDAERRCWYFDAYRKIENHEILEV